jgi:hypothetical protein
VVEYILTVSPSGTPYSFTVSRRYSLLHELYLKIRPVLETAFPHGMHSLFPCNRIKGYVKGSTDQLCDTRKEEIDKWFREILLNPRVMIDLNTFNTITSFVGLPDRVVNVSDFS